MTVVENVVQKMADLPPGSQLEVLDFVEIPWQKSPQNDGLSTILKGFGLVKERTSRPRTSPKPGVKCGVSTTARRNIVSDYRGCRGSQERCIYDLVKIWRLA